MTLQHIQAWLTQALSNTSLGKSTVTVPSSASLCFVPSGSSDSRYWVRQIRSEYEFDAYHETLQKFCHLVPIAPGFSQKQWPHVFSELLQSAIPHLWLVLDQDKQCIALFKLALDDETPDHARLEALHDLSHCTLLTILIPMLVSMDYGFEHLGLSELQVQFDTPIDGMTEFLRRLGFEILTTPGPVTYRITAYQYYQPLS